MLKQVGNSVKNYSNKYLFYLLILPYDVRMSDAVYGYVCGDPDSDYRNYSPNVLQVVPFLSGYMEWWPHVRTFDV